MSVALWPDMSKLACSPLFLLPAFGCVAGIDPADESAAHDATYTRTIVRCADNGCATVTTEPVTATEQQLEHEAAVADLAAGGERRTVAIDSCADWNATKFFDQTNYTGNELCLIGSGNGRLDQYCRIRSWPKLTCLRSWSESTRSLWTGASVVWLSSVYGSGGACAGGVWSGLPAYEAYATVDACIQLSDQFSLTPQ